MLCYVAFLFWLAERGLGSQAVSLPPSFFTYVSTYHEVNNGFIDLKGLESVEDLALP